MLILVLGVRFYRWVMARSRQIDGRRGYDNYPDNFTPWRPDDLFVNWAILPGFPCIGLFKPGYLAGLNRLHDQLRGMIGECNERRG